MHTLEQVLRNRTLVVAHPDDPVLDVAQRMTSAQVGCVSVIDDEEMLVGVFSERDLMTRVLVPGRDAARLCVREVMTRNVVAADLHDGRDPCLDKMQRTGCRHLPILADGHVIAMLSMRDLLWDEIAEQTEEIRHLRAYVYQTPPA